MKMKILFLLFVLSMGAIGTPAQATPINNTMADKFYLNCVAGGQQEGTMSQPDIEKYCACTSNNMQRVVSVKELGAIGKDTPEGRAILNKVIVQVNAPCSEFPISAMVQKECIAKGNSQRICGCLSVGVGKFLSQKSENWLGEILTKNPNTANPMAPIYENPEFIQAQQQIGMSCAMQSGQ